MENDKDELIKATEAEIARLRQQLSELKDPTSIARLLKTQAMYTTDFGEVKLETKFAWRTAWGLIRSLCIELVRAKHKGAKKLKVKDLTHEECVIAAEFADEVISVWNKYCKKLYFDEEESDVETKV